VRDPFDLDVGEHLPEELELGGAGLTVPGGHGPDGAAVQGHPVSVAGELLEVGEISLLVEHAGEERHLLVEVLARHLRPSLLDPPVSAALEDAGDELWVFLLDVAEQLDRKIDGDLGEHGLGEIGAVVEVGRAPRPAPLLTGGDDPGGPEGGQVLTDTARSDPQRLRQLFGRCLPSPFERDDDLPLRGRKINERRVDGIGHAPSVLPTRPRRQFDKYQLVELFFDPVPDSQAQGDETMTRPAITGHSTMGEVLEAYPSAQRALFRRYHIGGATLRPLRSAVSQAEGFQSPVVS